MATELIYRRANEVKLDYAPRISRADWARHETVIRQLHAQNVTKKNILQELGEIHGFHPTLGQLNAKTRKWGLKVYGVQTFSDSCPPARTQHTLQRDETPVDGMRTAEILVAPVSAAVEYGEAESGLSTLGEAQKATSEADHFAESNILPWLNQLGYDPPSLAFQAGHHAELFGADDLSALSEYLRASESAPSQNRPARSRHAVPLSAQCSTAIQAPEIQTLCGEEDVIQLPLNWDNDDESSYGPKQDGSGSEMQVDRTFSESRAPKVLFYEHSDTSSQRAFRTMAIRLKGQQSWISRKSDTSMSIESRDSWSFNGVYGMARPPASTNSSSKHGLLNLRPTILATEDWNTLHQHLHLRFNMRSDHFLHLDCNEGDGQPLQVCYCGSIECTAEANFPCAARILEMYRESLKAAEQKTTQSVIPRDEQSYALRQSMQLSTQYIHARLNMMMTETINAEWNGDGDMRDQLEAVASLAEGNVKGLFFGIEHVPTGYLVDTSRLILFSERIRRDVLLVLLQYMERLENRTTKTRFWMESQ